MPQMPAAQPASPSSAVENTENLVQFFNKAPYEFWLTCIIIVFGLCVLLILLWAARNTETRRLQDISRSLIVVMVIISSLVLITAGYSNEQVAPAFGLLGTIIGYMLGRLRDTPSGEGAQLTRGSGPSTSAPVSEVNRHDETGRPAQ